MRIKDLFSGASSGTYNSGKVEKYSNDQINDNNQAVGNGGDRVSISARAQQLRRVTDILRDDATVDKSRIAAIKAKVDAGTYQVPSEEVAGSLLSFIKDA
jgi:negative regulator of flagellin synthesis FlgM